MRKRATELTIRTLGVVAWLAAAATAAYFGFYDSTANDAQREPVAKLLKASGDVEAHSPNLLVWTPVAAGHEFGELDHLATAANGRATLLLPSGHRLELGSDAHVILERETKGGKAGSNYTVALNRGELRVIAEPQKGAAGDLTIASRQRTFKLVHANANAKLELHAFREGPLTVKEMVGVKASAPVAVAVAVVTPVPAPPAPAQAAPETPIPAPPAPLTPPPESAAPLAKSPVVVAPPDGTSFWATGGTAGKSVSVTVDAPPLAKAQGQGLVLVTDVTTGKAVARLPVRPEGGHQTLTLRVADVAGALHGGAAQLWLEGAVERQGKTAGDPSPKRRTLRLHVPGGGDAQHFVASYGGGAPAPALGVGLVQAADRPAGSRTAVEVFGGDNLGLALGWLARRSDLAIAPGGVSRGGKSVYFLRGKALVAVAARAEDLRGGLAELAQALGATTVIEAAPSAMVGADRFHVAPGEMTQLLQASGTVRIWVVLNGKARSLSPELVLKEKHTLDLISRDGIGPFKAPVAVLYSNGGG